MPPKRKSTHDKGHTKKIKETVASPPPVDNVNWKEKSIAEFNLQIANADASSDDDQKEWKIYYGNRKKAQSYHEQSMKDAQDDGDDNMGMQVLIREKMEEVLKSNTQLTEKEKKDIIAQFLFTKLYSCFEDSDIDDMRSCTVFVTAYSDHSFSSVKLKFDYHLRGRLNYTEFHRYLRFGYWTTPSKPKVEDRMWFSNMVDDHNDEAEDRIFVLVLRDIKKMKELLLNQIIRDKLTNYEFLQLLMESVGCQFGASGHASDDDWIGYNNRVLCGCPTEEDYKFKHPVFPVSVGEPYEDEFGDSFVIPGLGSAPGRIPKGCPQQ